MPVSPLDTGDILYVSLHPFLSRMLSSSCQAWNPGFRLVRRNTRVATKAEAGRQETGLRANSKLVNLMPRGVLLTWHLVLMHLAKLSKVLTCAYSQNKGIVLGFLSL